MQLATSRSTTTALGVIALGLLFSACRPKPPEAPPAPVPPAPEVAVPAAPGAAGEAAPVTTAAVDASTPATTGSGKEPASAPRTLAAPEPDLATMKLAVSESAKLGAPVDLRYQVDGAAEPGRPVTVHLAAVPRVGGADLSVSVKDTTGLKAAVAPLIQQKASAGTAYRQQMAVTRATDGPTELRVLVTMEMPEGSAFSWFGVPLVP